MLVKFIAKERQRDKKKISNDNDLFDYYVVVGKKKCFWDIFPLSAAQLPSTVVQDFFFAWKLERSTKHTREGEAMQLQRGERRLRNNTSSSILIGM